MSETKTLISWLPLTPCSETRKKTAGGKKFDRVFSSKLSVSAPTIHEHFLELKNTQEEGMSG